MPSSAATQFKAADKTAIIGRSGCGKSFLCRRLQKMWPRRVIIDSMGEYRDHKEVFYDFKAITARLIRAHENAESSYALVFQFDPEADNEAEIFNELIRVLYYLGNVLVVIEEVQNFSSPHFLPHWLRRALLTGRHRGMGLMFTTQRPGELNKTIVSQCSHIFCGNLIDRNDLNYVSNFLNQRADDLINLKDRRFIWRSPAGISEVGNEF